MTGKDALPQIPMGPVISKELEIIGSHGMQAHQYPAMLALIQGQKIPLEQMIGEKMDLTKGAKALMQMGNFRNIGVMVIDSFL